MTREEALKELKNIRECGYIDKWYDEELEALEMAIKALEQNESAEEWYKLFVEKLEQEQEPLEVEATKLQKAYNKGFEDCRQAVLNQIFYSTDNSGDVVLGSALRHRIENLPSVKQEPPTGHWMRKTKVDGVYDIAGVKTWGVKCQCDKCDFTTTVVEDFGYYKYCPNCGCAMKGEIE